MHASLFQTFGGNIEFEYAVGAAAVDRATSATMFWRSADEPVKALLRLSGLRLVRASFRQNARTAPEGLSLRLRSPEKKCLRRRDARERFARYASPPCRFSKNQLLARPSRKMQSADSFA